MAKKTVLNSATKEHYTGLNYGSLISGMNEEPKENPEASPKKKAKVTKPQPEAKPEQKPEGFKYAEKRTRRVQLVFQPSLYEKAEAKYRKLGYKSFNDYIHSLLEAELN